MTKMEENIPLEKSKGKEFKNTVSGIKNLIKSGKIQKKGKNLKGKQNNNKAVVYIGHTPHGFYEEEMRDFFKQFGKVTNVRVARSAKNGNSKGYGFVEFAEREVAEIAAETMNNYLMDKRLLKAECIPATRTMSSLFRGKPWKPRENCPGIKNRNENKTQFNKETTDEEWIKDCQQRLKRIHNTKNKLKELGIEFDFTPSDVPEQLINYDPAAKSSNKNSTESTGNGSIQKGNIMKLLNKKNVQKNGQTDKIKESKTKPETDVQKSSAKSIDAKKGKIVKHIPKKGKSILSGGKKMKK